jgi:hypothetical protein
MTVGIVTGLAAAFCQSLGYLATRYYVQPRKAGASRELLVLAHIWMGLFSLVLLPFVWVPEGWMVLKGVMQPLILSVMFYLGGQLCLMLALKHAEPSRVSPLLGFKIVVLAGMATVMAQPAAGGKVQGLTWLQWVAVALSVTAAVALNFSGARLRRRALAAVVLACVAYSMSDWNIATLVVGIRTLAPESHAPFLAGAFGYTLSGILALCFFPFVGTRDPKAWRDSAPFASFWFAAMLMLYTCFGLEGPLLGNILQSTRGLMSILLGSLLVYWGHFHIEPLGGKGVFARRLAAGVLMFLAVSLYVIRDLSVLQW